MGRHASLLRDVLTIKCPVKVELFMGRFCRIIASALVSGIFIIKQCLLVPIVVLQLHALQVHITKYAKTKAQSQEISVIAVAIVLLATQVITVKLL